MTPHIFNWANRHHVSLEALNELQAMFGMHGGHTMPEAASGKSEAAVQAVVRLEAANKGLKLFRNNVGALLDTRGVPVRYGLANDSKQVNEVIKSADLIGWRPIIIEQRHVGQVIGQFVSREVKEVGWHYTGNDREPAQLAWAQLVTAGGGDAAFCTGEGTL
jgi:hypothetical protein